MTKKWTTLIALLIFFAVPAMALGGSTEGTIQGFNCVIQGKVCPIGKEDPLVIAEKVFVLHTGGSNYFFLPSIDRALLARLINEKVKAVGDKSSKYNSIKTTDLFVERHGKWKKVWSNNIKDPIYKGVGDAGFPLAGS